MSNCKTEADLHDEYARVIRMCEGTKVDPKTCVILSGIGRSMGWSFYTDVPDKYSFALAIVEDKPVW